jgi:GxxExxY protein
MVHSQLGPGLLESVYELCLEHELAKAGLHVQRQVPHPVCYDGLRLDGGLRLDLLVENQIVIEVKAVDAIHPVHEAQLLTYLKLTERRLGFLMNFNVAMYKDGVRRFVL